MATVQQRARLAMLAAMLVALAWWVFIGPTASTHAADLEPSAEAAVCTAHVESAGVEASGLVSIQSLAQGNVFDHGPPTSILLVSARPDPIVAVIDPAAAPTVAGVDLSTNVLVALFIGRWPQEGHHVTIQSVLTTDSGVCLTAQVTRPTPGQDAADAETYPYHVVSVPLAALPQTPGTSWTVVSQDGATIASTRFP